MRIFFTTGSRTRREIFFYNGKNGRKKNGKGTEGEKTECKDWSAEWAEDGGTIFFVLRATARCTKRVSILDNT